MVGTGATTVMGRAEELAACTEVAGEITRPYGTPSLARAAALITAWMEGVGLRVRRDAAGNVVGRRGPDGVPALLLGSHFASVRDAGPWDGALGILVALAALEHAPADGLALEVIAFADDEGLGLRSSLLASRAWAGLVAPAELAGVASDGVTLGDAMRAAGGDPTALLPTRRGPEGIVGYLEVHVEQGPVLAEAGLPVGIASAVAGWSRGLVDVVGRAAHAATTPPGLRADALAAAAEVVLAVEEEMQRTARLAATVGMVETHPNVATVVPGAVTLAYEVRHEDDVVREAAVERIMRRAYAIAVDRGLRVATRPVDDRDAVPMSPVLRARLARAVAAVGLPVHELTAGVGHDAMTVAEVTPEVAMLLVRCRDGDGRRPDASVDEGDVAAAVEVVTTFLEASAAAQPHPAGDP